MLTESIVKEIILGLTPFITQQLQADGDRSLYTKVLNQGELLFSGFIVCDSEDPNNNHYVKAASGKADWCMRTSLCSRETGLDAPNKVINGDMIWPGGVILNDLVVATSGAENAMSDEGYSNIILFALMRWCNAQVGKARSAGQWNFGEKPISP